MQRGYISNIDFHYTHASIAPPKQAHICLAHVSIVRMLPARPACQIQPLYAYFGKTAIPNSPYIHPRNTVSYRNQPIPIPEHTHQNGNICQPSLHVSHHKPSCVMQSQSTSNPRVPSVQRAPFQQRAVESRQDSGALRVGSAPYIGGPY